MSESRMKATSRKNLDVAEDELAAGAEERPNELKEFR